MTPALVIFDCDGVLVDSEAIAARVEAEMLTDLGYPITPEESASRFLGRPSSEMLREVEEALGRPLPSGFLARLERRIAAAYPGRLAPIDGIADVLARLDVPACVASSSTPSKLYAGLIETDLLDILYPHVFSTVLVANGKPAPDLFLYAAGRMGAAAEATVVVEDSVAGVKAGCAAGMAVVGFSGGSHCDPDHGERLAAAGAHAVIDRLDVLLDTIEAL